MTGCRHLSPLLATLLTALAALCGCSGAGSSPAAELAADTLYSPLYAKGFSITGDSCATLIKSHNPYQGARDVDTRLLLLSDPEAPVPAGYDGQVLRGGGARRIACMSTSHVAMLEALGLADRVVGVSGKRFVMSPGVAARLDSVAELGYEGSIDYEALLGARPDIVLLYGVNGASQMEPKLRELGIPYAYIGDYLEEHPLGKAEWLVPLAWIAGLGERGRLAYEAIPREYNALKALADSCRGPRPRVMLNTPYGDAWYMPSAGSYAVTLIADAGGEYVYPDNRSGRSVTIDMEQALALASGADVWLGASGYADLAALKAGLPRLAATPPVAAGRVWDPSLRRTPAGGSDYWEGGIVHPQLVLRDLIMIFHPGALPDTVPFTYYRRLP